MKDKDRKRVVAWTSKASREIYKAGGDPEFFLSQLSPIVLTMLIDNHLEIRYKP